MIRVPYRSADRSPLCDLDEMILRAEAACVRYRRAADNPGLTPIIARMRRDSCQAMEKTLARLRAQRTAGADS